MQLRLLPHGRVTVLRNLRLLPGIIIPTGEGLPFVGKARQSEHSRAYVTFGATQQTGGKTSQPGINSSRNSLSTEPQRAATDA